MLIDTDVEALAATQHGLVGDRQVRALGASEKQIRHRLRTGRWVRHRPGVYRLVGAVVTPQLELMAATLGVRGSVVSNESAAARAGRPGFCLLPAEITVASGSVRVPRDLVVHRTRVLPEQHVRVVDGIPCTSVARTLFDCCGSVRPGRAERALERAFVELLRAYDLPQPARQVDLGDADGWAGRVDFRYAEQRVIVEVDGQLGHSALLDATADVTRDRRLTEAGSIVPRFTWGDVTGRPGHVAQTVRDLLAARVPRHDLALLGADS